MVSDASVDAKLCALQNIEMDHSEAIVEYSNRLLIIVHELMAISHEVTESEKKHILLRRLTPDFEVISQVMRTTEKRFGEDVSSRVVAEASKEKKHLAGRHF